VAEGFTPATMTGTDGLHLNNAGHDFYTRLIEQVMSEQTGLRRQTIDGILASLLSDPASALSLTVRQGIPLASPNGTRFRVSVDDDGALTTTSL
jgi:hypothetical protein